MRPRSNSRSSGLETIIQMKKACIACTGLPVLRQQRGRQSTPYGRGQVAIELDRNEYALSLWQPIKCGIAQVLPDHTANLVGIGR